MKLFKTSCILALVLVFSCESVIDGPIIDIKSNFLPKGKTNQIVKHKYYTLSYSEPNEQAEWVAYLLTAAMPSSAYDRKDDFRPDPSVTTGSATLADYQGSGYDRGHLCPAADMSFSAEAISETFYLSNMSPQDPSFNRGIWSSLEAQVRTWAIDYDSLYVVTGPVLTTNKGTIGADKVTVPKYHYKVILHYTASDTKMMAFLLPNEKGVGSIKDYVVTTDSVESLTGIDFFPALPDNIELTLESKCNPDQWNFGGAAVKSGKKRSAPGASQCLGTAKSTGQRCKNSTTNENGYCNVHQNQAPGYVKPASNESSPDGRCMAVTKKGTRCTRSAEQGSKYCWQHQR